MLILENVSKNYGSFRALDGVELLVPSASVFALPGPNGSGKTTLLKIVLGLVKPQRGARITLDGQSIESREYRSSIVYMPQVPNFMPHLKVKELISLVQQLRQQDAVREEELIHDLCIGRFWNRRFGDLSGGMKQKVNILQALMFDFSLAVLDEPTASLDPGVAYYLKSLIHRLADEEKTILFTSHIMSEVQEMAEIMALLVNGKLLLTESPTKFTRSSGCDTLEKAVLEYWKDCHAN